MWPDWGVVSEEALLVDIPRRRGIGKGAEARSEVCERAWTRLTTHRRIRGDPISTRGLLDSPMESIFIHPIRTLLRGHTYKLHQQRCYTRRRQHAFSVRAIPFWNICLPAPSVIVLFFLQVTSKRCSIGLSQICYRSICSRNILPRLCLDPTKSKWHEGQILIGETGRCIGRAQPCCGAA